jgi:protein SCO1/2
LRFGLPGKEQSRGMRLPAGLVYSLSSRFGLPGKEGSRGMGILAGLVHSLSSRCGLPGRSGASSAGANLIWLQPLLCLLTLVAGCGRKGEQGGGTPAPAVVAGRVAVDADAPNIAGTPFKLTDQTGKEFSSADLVGKVWLGSIFFANCPGPCFRENQAVAEILKEIADPDFMAVSLTCDPANDTPEVLARYGERFEADAARWKFLTGDMQTITAVGMKTFRLPVEVGVHSERGVVFDRQGRLRGGYHLLQADRVAQLKKLIRDVLAEPAGTADGATP